MKNRENRLFWSAMGAKLLNSTDKFNVSALPRKMSDALAAPPDVPSGGAVLHGEDLQGNKGRYIYMQTWKILREMGFSRPFKHEVFPGIQLFIPFVRGRVVVLPQGFQRRVPLLLRAYALVGKSAALRACGFHLVVASAVYRETVFSVLSKGNCSVCTPDKLVQLITALDL